MHVNVRMRGGRNKNEVSAMNLKIVTPAKEEIESEENMYSRYHCK
jgi:hypothetical protein